MDIEYLKKEKMSKIPTAEEICNKQFFGFKGELWVGVHKAMIEFAKLHVEAALLAAEEVDGGLSYVYPLENIK